MSTCKIIVSHKCFEGSIQEIMLANYILHRLLCTCQGNSYSNNELLIIR